MLSLSLSLDSGNLPITHKLLELYVLCDRVSKTLPKQSRYTLGTRILDEILSLIELALLAASKASSSRLLILQKMDVRLKLLQLLIRLLHKTKSLSDAAYIELAEHTVELSKMCGGWIAATKNKTAGL